MYKNDGVEVILEVEEVYEDFIVEVTGHLFDQGVIAKDSIYKLFGKYDTVGRPISPGMETEEVIKAVEGVVQLNGYQIKQEDIPVSDSSYSIYQLVKKVSWSGSSNFTREDEKGARRYITSDNNPTNNKVYIKKY